MRRRDGRTRTSRPCRTDARARCRGHPGRTIPPPGENTTTNRRTAAATWPGRGLRPLTDLIENDVVVLSTWWHAVFDDVRHGQVCGTHRFLGCRLVSLRGFDLVLEDARLLDLGGALVGCGGPDRLARGVGVGPQ